MAVITTTSSTNNNNKHPKSKEDHCTLAVVRALTRPFVIPPTIDDLRGRVGDDDDDDDDGGTLDTILMSPWNVRVPIDPKDYTTRHHWKSQKQTTLFHSMFDWDNNNNNNDITTTTDHPPPPPAAAAGASPTAATAAATTNRTGSSSTASLHPYFSFGQEPNSPFFSPWQDVGNCLRHLLLHQIGCHQTSQFITLTSHDVHVFIATAPNFPESHIGTLLPPLPQQAQAPKPPPVGYYLLRCHYDARRKLLIFGYHHRRRRCQHDDDNATKENDDDSSSCFLTFHKVLELSILDDDWRLNACIVLKNLARIIHCHKDYTVPLFWSPSTKLSLVVEHRDDDKEDDSNSNNNNNNNSAPPMMMIQKIYTKDSICNTFNASVQNMIDIYQTLKQNNVPHTDRLVSVQYRCGKRRRIIEQQRQQQQAHASAGLEEEQEEDSTSSTTTTTICKFAPIGRSYLPENLQELLQALICIAEALVALHSINIMHRDIRWANVFHALRTSSTNNSANATTQHDDDDDNNNNNTCQFTTEWVLFDFEFAARVPQPAFGAHTLTPGNHAPEMINQTDTERHHYHHTQEQQQQPQPHDTAVDIWGLGYLIQNCHVDIPQSHAVELQQLQTQCLQREPEKRPRAAECLEILQKLSARPQSQEKTVTEIY